MALAGKADERAKADPRQQIVRSSCAMGSGLRPSVAPLESRVESPETRARGGEQLTDSTLELSLSPERSAECGGGLEGGSERQNVPVR